MNLRWQFPDGQIVLLDRPFTRGGVNYPENWLRLSSAEDRAAWDLTELPEPEAPVTPALPTVPSVVTPRQARLALNAAGLRDTVEAAVAAAPIDIRDAWEYALEIRRDDPLIVALAASIPLTEAQLDDLFTAAAAL